ncbi:MAG: anthranilate synthase component I [Pirellulaceae bacterium]|nr:anthranilate synthase component I [Mariniblastus sp.]MDB4755898.1 anthranilate synthase component I [Mariniblastus sp.]MDG2470387.1 anthranilate synthase component I [Pirellulaceae bacterium]
MPHQPDLSAFKDLAAQHSQVPVYRCMISDGLTPVSAFRKVDDGKTCCLFESVVGGEKVGRYSFIAIQPFAQLSASGSNVTIQRSGQWLETESQNPFDRLREELRSIEVAQLPGMPPFVGGAVGYAGYDTVRYVENLPSPPEDDRGLPDLSFAFYDQMIVFDNVQKTMTIIVLAKTNRDGQNAEKAFAAAAAEIDQIVDRLQSPSPEPSCFDIDLNDNPSLQLESNFSESVFKQAVEKCVDYIKAGDIFQVVISQRFQREISCDPFEIYRSLRVMNPSPFMFFLRTPETTLIGSSPEIMCRVVNKEVTVRPLAGTRGRGQTDEEDQALEKELLTDPKERAEHVMLVDLGRNDVGRVSKFGTVEIPDVMVVERYSHVMHISSTVTGELRDEFDAFDALMASLPAGTVSGAPKVRAMEIIDEIEPHRRGPYAGAVGYVDFNGNMDTCIALRTMVVKDDIAYVQAGAGIVAESNPDSEYRETINKATALLRAIDISEKRSGRNNDG